MAIGSPYKLVPGTHIWVALNGATLSDASNVIKPSGDATSYTTVGRTAKPSDDDTTWVKLGIVKSGGIDPGNGEVIEIQEPMPGALQVVDRLRLGAKPKVTFTAKQVQALTLQLLWRSAALTTASAIGNPLAVNREVYAWLSVQLYDNADTNRINLDAFVEIALSNPLSLDPAALTEPEYEANILASALNVFSA